MDRIFKTALLSLEWHWDLLPFNIIPIFFKNNIIKKTKTCSMKKNWTATTVFSQIDTYLSGWETVVKEIFNLDHFAKVCSLQILSRNWSYVQGNFVKSRRFYNFFLNINVVSFYFHFLQRMLSHPPCYLKRALFKARKSWFFVCS